MTKECFGNLMSQSCRANGGHYECKDSGSCFLMTNEMRGVCECKYKQSCPPSRQAIEHSKGNDKSHECKMYIMLD